MEKFFKFIIIYKKMFSLLLSFVILINSLSFVLPKSNDFADINEVYSSYSIAKYYNLISLLPIKIVSEFFNSNIEEISSVTTNTTNRTEKKNKKEERSTTTDFAFVSSDAVKLVQNYSKTLKYDSFVSFILSSLQQNYFNVLICLLVLLFISVFKGSMSLARDSIENKKIINKYKVIRLV